MDTDLNTPLLSVTMTVYNAEAFLEEAIDSVLNQTYRDFEFLILDDASTDSSAKIIFEKQALDARIKYFKNDVNSGLAKTKNKIIGLSKGQIIAVVDADDVNVLTRFEKQMSVFINNPDIHVMSAAMWVMNSKGKVCDTWYYPDKDEEIKQGFESASLIAHPASMFRREVFTTLNGYNEQLAISEDWDYFYRATKHFNFTNSTEPLVYYRFHESNTSVTKLAYTVLYAVYFKHKLPMSVFELTLPEFVKQYPHYKADVYYNINRFYIFSIDNFLKLGYQRLSYNLYKSVTTDFFVFFDRASKKGFIKSVIATYLKNRYLKKLPALLNDYFFLP